MLLGLNLYLVKRMHEGKKPDHLHKFVECDSTPKNL
jgi:hypothetical protein